MPDVKPAALRLVESVGANVGIRWGTEEPRFTVQTRVGDVEIRRYGPRIAAETAVRADDESARNIGFRRLATYIFGDNRPATKIAMTAPVAQRPGERIAMTAPVAQTSDSTGESVIRFFMPSKWTLDTLPEPEDADVQLVEVPAQTLGLLRFTGDRSSPAQETAR